MSSGSEFQTVGASKAKVNPKSGSYLLGAVLTKSRTVQLPSISQVTATGCLIIIIVCVEALTTSVWVRLLPVTMPTTCPNMTLAVERDKIVIKIFKI